MEFDLIYELLAKNIINDLKKSKKKYGFFRNFFKNFSCKSSCAFKEEDKFNIILEHIKKLENHKLQYSKKLLSYI